MNYWAILEIAPTDESSLIKKAYAKRLKIYHPEDDPQGFQRLKEAYDLALRYAKNSHKTKNTNLIDDKKESKNIAQPNESVNIEIASYFFEENVNKLDNVDLLKGFINSTYNHEQLIQVFFEKVEDLYNDFFSRIEMKNWENLLIDDALWILDVRKNVNQRMIEFLMEHHHLPKDVWRFLDNNFRWIEQEKYLYSSYHLDSFIKFLSKQLKEESRLRFCYFNKNENINYEEYLNYREEAFYALQENNLEEAWHNIEAAFKMYPNDPDLLCMKGKYYFLIGDKEKGDTLFQDAIQINPDDMELYFYQAQILYNHGDIYKSVDICKYILRNNSSHTGVKNLLTEMANKLSLKLKWYSLNIKLRYTLDQIYKLLGDNDKRFKQKIINFFKPRNLLKAAKYLFIGFILIILLVGTKSIALLIIVYLIYKKKGLS